MNAPPRGVACTMHTPTSDQHARMLAYRAPGSAYLPWLVKHGLVIGLMSVYYPLIFLLRIHGLL